MHVYVVEVDDVLCNLCVCVHACTDCTCARAHTWTHTLNSLTCTRTRVRSLTHAHTHTVKTYAHTHPRTLTADGTGKKWHMSVGFEENVMLLKLVVFFNDLEPRANAACDKPRDVSRKEAENTASEMGGTELGDRRGAGEDGEGVEGAKWGVSGGAGGGGVWEERGEGSSFHLGDGEAASEGDAFDELVAQTFTHIMSEWDRCRHCLALNPKSHARNPNPELRTPNPEPRSPNPETRTPKPSAALSKTAYSCLLLRLRMHVAKRMLYLSTCSDC